MLNEKYDFSNGFFFSFTLIGGCNASFEPQMHVFCSQTQISIFRWLRPVQVKIKACAMKLSYSLLYIAVPMHPESSSCWLVIPQYRAVILKLYTEAHMAMCHGKLTVMQQDVPAGIFPNLPNSVILDYVRQCVIQDAGAWECQKEQAMKEECSGNRWYRGSQWERELGRGCVIRQNVCYNICILTAANSFPLNSPANILNPVSGNFVLKCFSLFNIERDNTSATTHICCMNNLLQNVLAFFSVMVMVSICQKQKSISQYAE